MHLPSALLTKLLCTQLTRKLTLFFPSLCFTSPKLFQKHALHRMALDLIIDLRISETVRRTTSLEINALSTAQSGLCGETMVSSKGELR